MGSSERVTFSLWTKTSVYGFRFGISITPIKFNKIQHYPHETKSAEAKGSHTDYQSVSTRANGKIGQRASKEDLQRLDLSDDMTASNCVFSALHVLFQKAAGEKCHVVESTKSILLIKWPLWLCSEDLNF